LAGDSPSTPLGELTALPIHFSLLLEGGERKGMGRGREREGTGEKKKGKGMGMEGKGEKGNGMGKERREFQLVSLQYHY